MNMSDFQTETATTEIAGPELTEALREMLDGLDGSGGSIESAVTALERTHSTAVYSELIHVMSHLRFPLDEAKRRAVVIRCAM